MIDLVYVLGRGSRCNDQELRYSLSSARMFLHGMGRVFVVGARPRIADDFGINWVHVPVTDRHDWPACNINDCLRRACQIEELSDTFLRVDDDCFFLRDQHAEATPYYRRGDLPTHRLLWKEKPKAPYARSLQATELWLKNAKLPLIDFEVHGPILFHKRTLGAFLAGLNPAVGYLVRSLYVNMLRLEGEPLPDCKINSSFSLAQIKGRLLGKPFFSIGDSGYTLAMRTFLERAFSGQFIG